MHFKQLLMAQKHNILYVDDEQDNLLAFKAVFRRDFNVFIAPSGQDAIEVLKEQAIDMVISDQRMPHMTGLELFQKIIPDYPSIVRMVVTGYSEMEPILNAVKKGDVAHYMTKPWKVEELKGVINGALVRIS